MAKKKGRKKKSKKKSGQRVGWGKLDKSGRYKRQGRRVKYSPVRDAMRKARHKSADPSGQPFAGDNTPVYIVVNKKTGRPLKQIWYKRSDIPKKYKNSKNYKIKHGWI